MATFDSLGLRWMKALAFTGALFVIVVGFSGCAASGGSVDSNSGITTPSDETETHRRARIRLELAASYFESGQTTVALDEVKQALVIDPAFVDAHNLRGLIFMRLNDYAQAEDSFHRALALRPHDAGIRHNYAWLLCQQKKYVEANREFLKTLSNPAYVAKGKSLMAQGLCQARAGLHVEAEETLTRAYQADAGNPIVAYNLALLLMQRGELVRAQFYIRRLNNTDLANAESLWLGIKVERALQDPVALRQLATQLRKRFPDSRELSWYEQGIFNE